ncbi:MAG: hypothetical protein ABIZ34_08690 [Candidatus Limnocylindrales bacterium]
MEMPDRPPLEPPGEALAGALARLQGRWGSASIRLGNGDLVGGTGQTRGDQPLTHGALALALALEPLDVPTPRHDPLAPLRDDIVSTGFPMLDAALGPGGLPRQASAAIRGDLSSGKTTLALRLIAEAQAQGAIAAWLDLPRAFDPVDAVARGVDLRWLLVLRSAEGADPADPSEGFALAGALLSGRAVDLLVIDLPTGFPVRQEHALRRLSAHARRVGARFIVLEPPSLPSSLHGALAEVTGLRLELERESWIRLGRDVVGQQTRVTVAKNRFGPPGRHVALEIHYTDDGERRSATHAFSSR